jgi:hypothetical protein
VETVPDADVHAGALQPAVAAEERDPEIAVRPERELLIDFLTDAAEEVERRHVEAAGEGQRAGVRIVLRERGRRAAGAHQGRHQGHAGPLAELANEFRHHGSLSPSK